VANKVVELPAQIVAELTERIGNGFTVTTAVAVLEQVFAAVPVTTYVVVAVGFAVTGLPTLLLKVAEGVQL
jgi:hypothetical protein